jgi:hypothetical protein
MNTLRILLSIAFTVVVLKTTLAEAADTGATGFDPAGRFINLPPATQ